MLTNCFTISSHLTVLPSEIKNYGKVEGHPVSIEPLKALVEFTLFGGLRCVGFFINKNIVTLSNDCQDNLVYQLQTEPNTTISETAKLNELVPLCQGTELLRKSFKVVDKTLIFVEVSLLISFYSLITLNNSEK